MDADEPLSEVTDFDIDRSTAAAWVGFATKLADVLSVMDNGASLTIGALASETDARPPFVAFHASDSGKLIAEAAGNAQLGAPFTLTLQQQQVMEVLGWHPPASDGPGPHEIFWLEGTQEDAHVVADQAVAVLRDVYGVPHPAFLEPDQLAEILTPPPVAELPREEDPHISPEELVVTVPTSPEHLDRLVSDELTALLGYAPVRDEEGDYGIRVGSTMVFVRCSADAREILVFAPIVHEVDGRSRAMEVLNDLNLDARYVRFLLVRDRVFVSFSLFSHPFVPAHLRQALQVVSVTSDAIDNDLAHKLHGRTTFTDDGPVPGQ